MTKQTLLRASMVAGVALTAAGGFSTAWSIVRFDEATIAVDHTLNLLDATQMALNVVTEVEAASRGFLLTGQPLQRQRFERAVQTLPAHLQHVRDLVGIDSEQLELWRQVEAAAGDRVAVAEQLLFAYDRDRDEAQALLRSGRGAELTEAVQRGVRAFETVAQTRLMARQQGRNAALRRSFLLAGLTGLAGMLFVSIAGFVAMRESSRRSRAAEELRRALTSLREASAERDRFFALSLDVMCVAGADGYFKFVSPAATTLLGWSAEELLARPFLDFVHPDDHAASLREVDRLVRAGEPVLSFQNRYRHRDGTYRVLSWKAVPEPGGLMYATGRDVTVQQAAEAEMRQLVERLDLATRGAGVGVFEWDAAHDRATWDATTHALFGVEPGRFGGTWAEWAGLVHPDDREAAAQAVRAALVQGDRFEFGFRVTWPDGSVRHLQSVGKVERDTSGQATRLVGVNWDDTDRRRLARQRQLILDTSAEGIYGIGLDGLCTFVNARAARLLGYEPAEIIGQHNHWLFHHHRADGAELPLQECRIYQVLATGEPAHVDTEVFWRKDGRSFPVEYRVAPMVESGEVRGVVVTFNDITTRLRAQEALVTAKAAADNANRAKSQFLANMSHELRTPLNAIIGFSEMLEDGAPGPLNPKQARYVANIQGSGRHLLALINDILDLAKIESGRLDLRPEAVAVAPMVHDVVGIVRPLADKKRITFANQVADGLPQIWADQSKAKQILYNLLSNAVKFTPDGGAITVTVSATGDQWLRVQVADTGIGVKPADHERVWREFEQVDSTYARAQQGTGLGLALTRRLVELHGGRIWLESDGVPGKGSTFVFELPITANRPAPDAAAVEPARRAAPFSADGRPLVLVVEDDEKAIGLLNDYLSSGGCQVAHARSAAEAIEMARLVSPAAITLDIILPDRPGWELVRDLKADPRTAGVPIVVVSVTEDRRLAASLGVTEFLVKPVGRRVLLDSLARLGLELPRL